jgi:hypothetical protein
LHGERCTGVDRQLAQALGDLRALLGGQVGEKRNLFEPSRLH